MTSTPGILADYTIFV